jgi:serpin B
MAAPDAARQRVNDWVDQETKGKIKDILPPGSIDPTTRMVLANAIYFKAAWQEPFREESTGPAAFTRLDGSQIQVPTMHLYTGMRYSTGDGYQAVALPYKGNLAEMLIILPDRGGFEAFENSLDAARFAAVLSGMRSDVVQLSLPRFEFTDDLDLKPILSALGMPLAFDPDRADFSNITKAERLLVDKALHKAYVLVNESGTEAAAATVMNAVPASLPQEMSVDRPFIFVIRDVSTGTILFVGRVLNPLDT